MFEPTVSEKTWADRIIAARSWREQREHAWQWYALLHRRLIAYRQRADAVCDEEETVSTPHGDNVRVGTVFRNVEQALALLDTKEIGVRATVLDYWKETDFPAVHRQSIAETALYRSLNQSGLLRGAAVDDMVSLDAVIIGHGISYSSWERRTQIVEERLPVLEMDPATGQYVLVTDALGEPVTQPDEREDVVFEGVQDEHVPVLEFLFEPTAKQISTARWHAREWVETLDALRDDERFDIPDGLTGGEINRRSLYGETEDESTLVDEGVRGITVFDCVNGELLHFLDAPVLDRDRSSATPAKEAELLLIGAERSPVQFINSTRSPFNAFVPIPAQDDASGISQIEHVRGLAAEVDSLRSRIANMTSLMKRVFLYDKGAGITQEDIDAALAARDFSFLGINMPDETKALTDLFHEFPVPAVRAEFYRLAGVAASDVASVTGVLEDPWAGGSSATEAEHKFNIGGARMQRKSRLKFRWLSELAETHLALLRAFAADGEPMQVESATGPMWLTFGREAIQGWFLIEVTAGGGATAVSPVAQKMAMEAANLLMPIGGPLTKMALTRQLLTMMDFPGVSEIMQAARQDLAMMSGQALGPTGPQAPPANVALGDYGVGQAVRAGINAPNE